MTHAEKNGRTIVLVIIAGSLLLSAVIIGAYVAALGTSRLPIQVVRFGLTSANANAFLKYQQMRRLS